MPSPAQASRANDPTIPLRVLLVGAGGRDHALAWKLAQSPRCQELHAVPGNAGLARLATLHDLELGDVDGIAALAGELAVDLAIIGPEDLLVAGLADRIEAVGVPCLGPSAAAARIEGSKVFAKQLMEGIGVPTPPWAVFDDADAATRHAATILAAGGAGVAVKADGLAAGRGAFVCRTLGDAEEALAALLEQQVFGESGRRVLVEELISGREVSVMVATDGEHLVPLPSARDYKRLADGDRGPNTGGMGAHAPCADIPVEELDRLADLAVRPMVEEMSRRGTPFRGVVYAGVMMTADGPQVLEYNCRFGNPETQALVRVLDVDLLDLLARAASGTLAAASPVRARGAAVAVCVASGSYPAREFEPEPVLVRGAGEAARSAPGVEVFIGMAQDAAGEHDTLRAAGGRVVTVSAHADTIGEAREAAYEAAARIDVPGAQLRHDIGSRGKASANC